MIFGKANVALAAAALAGCYGSKMFLAGDGGDDMVVSNQGDGTFLACRAVSGLPTGMMVSPSIGAAGDFDEDGLFDTTGQTTCSYCASTYYVHASD